MRRKGKQVVYLLKGELRSLARNSENCLFHAALGFFVGLLGGMPLQPYFIGRIPSVRFAALIRKQHLFFPLPITGPLFRRGLVVAVEAAFTLYIVFAMAVCGG